MADHWLKEQLEKIENKIDKLDTRIDNVDVTLAKQSVILDEHTRRSLANEEQVALLKKKFDDELGPVKAHVQMVHGAFKLIGLIATIAGIAEAVVQIISHFSSR